MKNHLWQIDLKSSTKGLFHQHQFYKKNIVVFNSASLCGFTEQLSAFEDMYRIGKIIPIAIPTNNFGNQEPGNVLEINQYYNKKFKVTFPIVDKTDISHDFFKTFGTPTWNFNKWLFNKEHNLIMKFDSNVEPKEISTYV